MITFSGVSLGSTLADVSFAFSGTSLCIVSGNIAEARAVSDLISGVRRQGEGGVSVQCGRVPTVSAALPEYLTVKELLDSVCNAGGTSITAYSYELAEELFGKVIHNLTPIERARAALAVLFACGSEAVIADRVCDGLLKNEREATLSLLLSVGEESGTAVIYTTDSASEMGKSEYVLALLDGKTLFFGKSEEFIRKATEPSPVAVRVMGERARAETFFGGMGIAIEDGVKKNLFKATLPADTDTDTLKRKIKSAGLALLDVRSEDGRIAELYAALRKYDDALSEQYEDYEEEHAAPRKLELSDFAFNRDDDEEDD